MKNIQTKLTVSILSFFLISLVTLGGLNYWKAREIITVGVQNDMERIKYLPNLPKLLKKLRREARLLTKRLCKWNELRRLL